MARVAAGALDWSAASRSRDDTVLGDGYVVRPVSGGALMAVVDGVGHGDEAAAATRKALEVLERHAEAPPAEQVRRCHEALQGTRGVAMGICRIDLGVDVLTWIGIGSVTGRLVRARPSRGRSTEMLLQGRGIVGRQVPSLMAVDLSLGRGDLLVLVTDGIRSDFEEAIRAGEPTGRLAGEILARYAARKDDALVLAARYLGGSG